MATPLETYFRRINPIMFPDVQESADASKVKLFNAWDAFSRELFTMAPRQLNRTRVYTRAIRKAAS